MGHKPEIRELAFKEWYAQGMIDDKAAAVMGEHGYVIARQTIAEWRVKYGWEERAARMDAARQEVTDIALTSDEVLLKSAYEQKARYDKIFQYFDGREFNATEINTYTQANHAYKPLLEFIEKLQDKINAKKSGKKQAQSGGGLNADKAAEIRNEVLGLDK